MGQQRIGFIGAGKMATALAQGLVSAKFCKPTAMFASDIDPQARELFSEATNAEIAESAAQLISNCEVVILAVKPQVLGDVLNEIAPELKDQHLVISIVSGVPLSTYESHLPDRRLVRVMPNTPCLVRAGASAFSGGTHASDEDRALARQILSTVGTAIEVPEKLLDAVTGLSGSGPAYVFEIIEAFSDGGVLMGLPRPVAMQLAAQTLMGAAKLVLETGEHPGALKDAVASPGGTTIAGLHELEKGGLRGILMNAVQAATQRAQELGRI